MITDVIEQGNIQQLITDFDDLPDLQCSIWFDETKTV